MRKHTTNLVPRRFFLRSGISVLVGSMVLILIAGCGSGAKKNLKAVSGTVKYRGAPLANGSIQFAPSADSKATTQGSSDIRDGKYEIAASHGLEPGKYQVRIFSTGSPRDREAGKQPGDESKLKQLPEQYNIRTQLEREVKENEPNTVDFDLK